MNKFILLFIFFSSYCQAQDLNLNRNQFYIGPEATYLERTKKGGARQDGSPTGLRLGYDRLKRYGWYVGAEGELVWGKLQGHSVGGEKIRSNFSSFNGEARLGYTFQQKEGLQASFTPFLGGGYYEERNYFISPSPLPIHFKTTSPYVSAGALMWMPISCNFEIGLNFKARFPMELKNYVSHDELQDNFTQLISERVQYRVDLPLTYRLTDSGNFALTLSPFWETRIYGSRINYPFDFLKTKFTFWGATVYLNWRI